MLCDRREGLSRKERYKQQLVEARLMEELGYWCYWFTKHHFAGYALLPACHAERSAASGRRDPSLRSGAYDWSTNLPWPQLRRLCCLRHLFGRVVILCDDLRATQTCGLAFLPPPAAHWAHLAGWQSCHSRRQQFHRPPHQTTIRTIEVPTGTAGTWCSEPEDFGWLNRARKGQQLTSDRLRLGEIRYTWFLNRPPDNPNYHTSRHVGLGTWAQWDDVCSRDMFHSSSSSEELRPLS